MDSFYFDLLKTWGDGLLRHQVKNMGEDFDGAFLCPACKYEHGRCIDAVYPLLYLAQRTGEEKYTEAAKAVFRWHARWSMTDEGSAYNDPNNSWSGITAFAAIALCEALQKHGSLLDLETRDEWYAQLLRMTEWVYRNIDEYLPTNINYVAAGAALLALAGAYLQRDDYTAQARHLLQYTMERFTENGLLWGEGHGRDRVTARGCRPIDIGYNVEESVPSLVKCALCLQEEAVLEKLTVILHKQLDFMLPDGAWDNTFGSRSYKWTYYGSRTSDGCAGAYALLANRDPLFPEAARRNLQLMASLTGEDGLLYGGVQYRQHGERPCIHHTFTHANALTVALEAGMEQYTAPASLPGDRSEIHAKFYPELATWKLTNGPWRATVTAYDACLGAGHASGGSMTLLWHTSLGAVLAGAVVDYELSEATDMQLSTRKTTHRTLVPRAEVWENDTRYANCYDPAATVSCMQDGSTLRIQTLANLVSSSGQPLQKPLTLALTYEITPQAVRFSGEFIGNGADRARYVLPVIPETVRPTVSGQKQKELHSSEKIFFLTGGFSATEYSLAPDETGHFAVQITV